MGNSPDEMECSQVFMNVVIFLNVFILHNIPGMLQRYNFFKEAVFLIQSIQKSFVFSRANAKANLPSDSHGDQGPDIFDYERMDRFTKFPAVEIIVVFLFTFCIY